jgi:hypothetical protein
MKRPMTAGNWCLLLAVLVLISFSAAMGTIGAGLSPAKFELNATPGQTIEKKYTVFNPGDRPELISLAVTGELAKFADLNVTSVLVDPEPRPLTVAVNGKAVKLTVQVPDLPQLTGSVVATVELTQGGGRVQASSGVSVQISQTKISFTKSVLAAVSAILIGVVILLVLLRRKPRKKPHSRRKRH